MKRTTTLVCVLALLSSAAGAAEWYLFHDGGKGEGWKFGPTQQSAEHPAGGHLHMKHVVMWTGEERDVYGNTVNRFGIIGADQDISTIDWDTAYLEFQVDTLGVVIPDVKLELHISKRQGPGSSEFYHTLATLGSEQPGYGRVRVKLSEFAKDIDELLGAGRKGRAYIFLMNTPRAPLGTVIKFDEVKIVDGIRPEVEAQDRPDPKFVRGPALEKIEVKDGRIVSAEVVFELDRPTDCSVRIFDAEGKCVRHLAAGKLGPTAPKPFAADALAQRIPWDGTDEGGKPLAAGRYSLKVQAKMTPRLGAILGEDPNALSYVHPVGIQADGKGNVYLLHRAGVMHQSPSHVYVFDRDGKYQREIMPLNPNVAPGYRGAQQKSNATGSVPSWANRFELSMLAFVPPDQLYSLGIDHGGSGTYPVIRHLVRLRTDGKEYREYTNTPFWVPKHWNLMWMAPTSPKTMLISDGAPRSEAEAAEASPQNFATVNPTCYHVVVHCLIDHYGLTDFPTFTYSGRRKLDEPRCWLGTMREAGDDAEHFNGPTGVATDLERNVYVCDSGNHKIKVFRSDGYYLRSIDAYQAEGKQFPLTNCSAVLIVPDGGAMYVTIDAEAGGKKIKRLIKFADRTGAKTVDTVDLDVLAGFNLALDASRKPHLIWTVKGGGRGTFTRIEDLGDRFGKVTHFGGPDQWKLMCVTSLEVDEKGTIYALEKNALYQRLVKLDEMGGVRTIDRWPDLPGYNSFTSRLRLCPDGRTMVINCGKEIRRYDRETGKPLDFAGAAAPAVTSDAENFHSFRGCAVNDAGDIYTLTHTKRPDTARGAGWNRVVEVFNADGTSKSKDFLGRIPGPLRDLAVDREGLVWLSTGAEVHRWHATEGKLWTSEGTTYSRYDGCGCMTPKLCVDDRLYGYVPDQRAVRVRVLDSAGNIVTDIGSYGNRDCRGKLGEYPDPPIPLQNPIAVAVKDDRLYIADYGNLRIVRVDLEHALEGALEFLADGTIEAKADTPRPAKLIIADDFEDGFDPGWSGTNTYVISEEEHHGGRKCAAGNTAENSGVWKSPLLYLAKLPEHERLFIRFWLKFSKDYTWPENANFMRFGQYGPGLAHKDIEWWIMGEKAAAIHVHGDEPVKRPSYDAIPMRDGRWHEYAVYVDYKQQIFRVWFDKTGDYTADSALFTASSTFPEVKHYTSLRLPYYAKKPSPGNGNFWIDDVEVWDGIPSK